MRERWTDPDLRLVLPGGVGSAEARDRRVERPSRVLRLGRVSAADRNGLLAMADAMVFPSEYEGFGAPLIEAMALGAPVVCSDATCMPGIVGDAGLVLPLEIDAWAGALDEVRRRRSRIGRGRQAPCAGVHVVRQWCRAGRRLRPGGEDVSDKLRIAVLCPHFAPDTAPTGAVFTRIVHELAELGHELHVITTLPWYREHAIEAGMERQAGSSRVDAVGIDHTRAPVSRCRQAKPVAPRSWLRRIQCARRPDLAARWPGRCRDRDVATADARPHRLEHASHAARTVGVQHSRRLSRRGRRDRCDHQSRRDRSRTQARAGELSPRRRDHGAVGRPTRQRRRQSEAVASRTGARDPELRRHRVRFGRATG